MHASVARPLLLAATIALPAIHPASAQEYPSRPIRLVASFPAGGGSDIVARVVAQKLSETWGQHVVVENKPGAAGNIGSETVVRATPDGYTLGVGTSASLALNPSLYSKLPFDTVRDLAPVTQLAAYSYVIVARSSFPAKTFKELIAYAKANPGKVNFASSGSATKMAGALLNSAVGMDITEVPFNGSAPALVQILGGHVDFTMAAALNVVQPHFKSGVLRPLAVTSAKRSPDLPDLPTIAESGVPGFEVTVWYGMIAPAKTPRDLIAKINAQVVQALRAPDVRNRVVATGAEVVGNSPAEFAANLKVEVEKWARVVKTAGIKPE
jgi:tripartite-type tricarboxylate transporter receptor subunit TctC